MLKELERRKTFECGTQNFLVVKYNSKVSTIYRTADDDVYLIANVYLAETQFNDRMCPDHYVPQEVLQYAESLMGR